MLSEQPFWWMMAGLIILVTVVVIRTVVAAFRELKSESEGVVQVLIGVFPAFFHPLNTVHVEELTPKSHANLRRRLY